MQISGHATTVRNNRVTGNTFRDCGVAVLFIGAGGAGNTFSGNTYTGAAQKKIVFRKGAEDAAGTNTLDAEAGKP